MDAVIRAAALYLFLLVIFRVSGRRTLSQATVVLLEDGEPIQDRMSKARVSRSDLLEKARSSRGLERLDQIKYAVLEKDGSVSIIPQAS